MSVYRICAFSIFGLSALTAIIGLFSGDIPLISAAVACAAMGVLFLGLAKVIELLQDIRNHHCGVEVTAPVTAPVTAEIAQVEAPKVVRSVAEISADLQRIKSRL